MESITHEIQQLKETLNHYGLSKQLEETLKSERTAKDKAEKIMRDMEADIKALKHQYALLQQQEKSFESEFESYISKQAQLEEEEIQLVDQVMLKENEAHQLNQEVEQLKAELDAIGKETAPSLDSPHELNQLYLSIYRGLGVIGKMEENGQVNKFVLSKVDQTTC
ncbi:hypothetical protein A0J61_10745 [Choanephora cucurbitarum]|uniref:Kinetochore protein Spc24 n=1 Tax=Choanephora cucurbitarum TaxID=101091 RepID=A0A1C7MXR4_9FUNG|nr:hypothetical protein A0J61_10745 [Choanephora cucurbitarum]